MTLSKDDLLRLMELIETSYPKMIDRETKHFQDLHDRLSNQLVKLTA